MPTLILHLLLHQQHDSDWQETVAAHFAKFHHLQPAKYAYLNFLLLMAYFVSIIIPNREEMEKSGCLLYSFLLEKDSLPATFSIAVKAAPEPAIISLSSPPKYKRPKLPTACTCKILIKEAFSASLAAKAA